MNPFREKLLELTRTYNLTPLSKRNPHPNDDEAAPQTFKSRQLAFQPIVGPKEQGFGSELSFLAESEDRLAGDPNILLWIMLDAWLLYGFEELTQRGSLFVKCTRETLMNGFLLLMPRSTVFVIQESAEPDDELLSVCRSLKAAGYRFALDDFEAAEAMEGFLDLANFIKVDFRHIGRRERACMLRDLKLTRATLIACKIETEEEFHHAVKEGFGLFQGYWVGERIVLTKTADPLDPMKCTCILGALEEPVSRDDLVALVSLESGIECRLLRRANWTMPRSGAIKSTRDALEIVGEADLQKLVTLAMVAASEDVRHHSIPPQQTALNYHCADALVRWMEMGAQTPWWHDTGRGSILAEISDSSASAKDRSGYPRSWRFEARNGNRCNEES